MFEVLKPLILASTSSIRQRVLRQAGCDFEVFKPQVDEAQLKATLSYDSHSELARLLSCEKALSLSAKYPQHHIIGADQIASLNGQILNKTQSIRDCISQLKQCCGQTHTLYSAVSLVKNNKVLLSYIERAQLTMKALTEAEIETYVHLDKPLYSCGGYYFEEHGEDLFSQVVGEKETILGLPLNGLMQYVMSR